MNVLNQICVLIILFAVGSRAQYAVGTEQYKQNLEIGAESLDEQIKAHPDVNLFFNPDRALLSANSYVFDYPLSAEYRIGILVDPCRYNAYNCCVNVYGSSEYRGLLSSGLETERVFKYTVLANETDVSVNYFLVYEDGNTIVAANQRSPDDNLVWNSSCVSAGNPFDVCLGRNYAMSRSAIRPPCMDNNQSLNTLNSCSENDGTVKPHCMQVGFSSNVFIPQCHANVTGNCGTFLEVHVAHGTPYEDETAILSSAKVVPRNVSGYYTMTMPTTYKFNSSRLLCSYTESVLRVGSIAYVLPTAPVCCCPPPYTSTSRVGSFQCPIGAISSGAFAPAPLTVADKLSTETLNLNYPFCHIDITESADRMMCSAHVIHDRKYYTRNCTTVNQTDELNAVSWSSKDMQGLYDGPCSYYESCTRTKAVSQKCQFDDLKFTFIGQVGLVTALDNSLAVPLVWLSFNGGRTSYEFNQQDVRLETGSKSMYEIWWVVRSYTEFTVQKRKGFNITSPACTFDTTNNRYFPFAIYRNGTTLDFSPTP